MHRYCLSLHSIENSLLQVYKTADLSLIAQFEDFDFHWVRALLLHGSGHLYIGMCL
jgi:hypothetical protein